MLKVASYFLFFFIFFISTINIYGDDQDDYLWWNKTHNWDGITPWREYLTSSPAFFGPSALPVAAMNRGIILNQFTFELRPEYHFSKGDKTTDLYTSLHLPLAKRVDFQIFIVPVEYFTLDSTTRHQRAVRHIDASGIEGGDFWFGTNFCLLEESLKRPSVLMSFYFKTASGTGLDYARFTDAPAYYISVSAGKNIGKTTKDAPWRIYGHAGFFAYQTWEPLYTQNDCLLYGFGSQYSTRNYKANIELSGYAGYLNNGDRPLIFKASYTTLRHQALNFSFSLQKGLVDFSYLTFSFSAIYKFGKTPEA